MPILSPIGRKSPSVRLFIALLYIILTLGSITMVYPFILMVAGSMRSGVDLKHLDAVPAFLYDDVALYRKHVEGLCNEKLETARLFMDPDLRGFEDLVPPASVSSAWVDAWASFLQEGGLPDWVWSVGYVYAPVSRTTPAAMRLWKEALSARYDDSLEAVNEDLATEFGSWSGIFILPPNALVRQGVPPETPFSEAFQFFRKDLPLGWRMAFSVEGFYRAGFLMPLYGKNVADYNRIHGTSWRSYAEIPFSSVYPSDATKLEQDDWKQFVLQTLHPRWTGLNELTREADVPLQDIRIYTVEQAYRDWLKKRFQSLEILNEKLGTAFHSWTDITPPQKEFHYAEFLKNRGSIRKEFVTRNYRVVMDEIITHGRGVYNTVVYCLLAVLAALIVNPLAAYAMSRFKLRSTYTLLLVLLLTMAFPPMVTQIPVFLMLRDFHLLNTFAALILPGLANGYSIFLLKGFFDSLPRDLFESAQIDGAGEWTMFWQITMSLSRPILAVIALQAFNMAYSNFMFALLICQDTSMWTLMVWLYQLQLKCGQPVVYASLIIAAIPTLLIFLFCQKIILRGIVIPSEK